MEGRSVSEIHQKISEYNAAHPEAPISFLHGGTSAAFSFMGREVTGPDGKKTHIADALIPTGQLRKRYGVYPVSGELELGIVDSKGRRKTPPNYKKISGMNADKMGVQFALSYANNFTQKFIDAKKIQENIETLIRNMDEGDYIRNLKLLVLQVSNLMLLSPEAGKAYAPKVRNMLALEFEVLKRQGGHDAEFERRFQKYTTEITKRLNGELYAFQSDDQFIQSIQQQFPVIYCSTVKGERFDWDMAHVGDIGMDTVKIIFTPHQYVDRLNAILKSKGGVFAKINVIGYNPEPKIEKKQEEKKEEKVELPAALAQFMKVEQKPKIDETILSQLKNVKSLQELQTIIASVPENTRIEYFKNIIPLFWQDYLKTGNEVKTQLMIWIFKNHAFPNNINGEDKFPLFDADIRQFNALKLKLLALPDYLEKRGDGAEEKFKKLSFAGYLALLNQCAIPNNSHIVLLNLTIHPSDQELQKHLTEFAKESKPNKAANRFNKLYSLITALYFEKQTTTNDDVIKEIDRRLGLYQEVLQRKLYEYFDEMRIIENAAVSGNRSIAQLMQEDPLIKQWSQDYYKQLITRPINDKELKNLEFIGFNAIKEEMGAQAKTREPQASAPSAPVVSQRSPQLDPAKTSSISSLKSIDLFGRVMRQIGPKPVQYRPVVTTPPQKGEKNKEIIDAANKQQALQLLKAIRHHKKTNPGSKIGIFYSANHGQTQMVEGETINAGNIKGIASVFAGSTNQGAVMRELIALLNDKRNHDLLDCVQILPISTCMKAGGKGRVSGEILQADLQNICDFAEEGNVILGWNRFSNGMFPIGGAVSKDVFSGMQNLYVQYYLKAFAEAESKITFTPFIAPYKTFVIHQIQDLKARVMDPEFKIFVDRITGLIRAESDNTKLLEDLLAKMITSDSPVRDFAKYKQEFENTHKVPSMGIGEGFKFFVKMIVGDKDAKEEKEKRKEPPKPS